ncbi:MAG: hypothetical protein WCZ90_11385 [Melioribacteraceae bacterium]
MLGLYYAIIGLLSGTICSLIANKKSLSQKDWFTIGQILPGVSILLLLLISQKKKTVEVSSMNVETGSVGTPTLADSLI